MIAALRRLREGWSFLLTKLNTFGSLVLAYALLNPNAAGELLGFLPPAWKTPAALAIPLGWWLLVQFAKAQAIKAEAAKAR